MLNICGSRQLTRWTLTLCFANLNYVINFLYVALTFFLKAASQLKNLTHEEIDCLFQQFDEHGVGFISFRQLHRQLRKPLGPPKTVKKKVVVEVPPLVDTEALRREAKKGFLNMSLRATLIEESNREEPCP